MQELMADPALNQPNTSHVVVFKRWSEGGWGSIITGKRLPSRSIHKGPSLTPAVGNVQIDRDHLGAPEDVALPTEAAEKADYESWRAWAQAGQKHSTPIIVQLCHPGRQSPLGSGHRGRAKSVAPSAVPLDLGKGHVACAVRSMVFGTPRALTESEIKDVVHRFARAALFVSNAGFSGIEIHAAHGYLLGELPFTPSFP